MSETHCMLRSIFGVLVLWVVAISSPSLRASNLSPLICTAPGTTFALPNDTVINANSCTDFIAPGTGAQPPQGLNNWLYGYYPQGVLNPATFTLLSPSPMYPATGQPIAGYLSTSWSVNPTQYWTSLDAFGGRVNASLTDLHFPPFCNASVYQNCSTTPAIDTRGINSPGSADQWTARRYLVPTSFSGAVEITMTLQKDPRFTGTDAQGTVHYIIKYSGAVATVLAVVVLPVNFDPNIANAPSNGGQGIPQPIYSITLKDVVVKPGDVIDFVAAADFNGSDGNQNFADFQNAWFELDTIKSEPAFLPEPASVGLVGGGFLLLLLRLRRRAR